MPRRVFSIVLHSSQSSAVGGSRQPARIPQSRRSSRCSSPGAQSICWVSPETCGCYGYNGALFGKNKGSITTCEFPPNQTSETHLSHCQSVVAVSSASQCHRHAPRKREIAAVAPFEDSQGTCGIGSKITLWIACWQQGKGN